MFRRRFEIKLDWTRSSIHSLFNSIHQEICLLVSLRRNPSIIVQTSLSLTEYLSVLKGVLHFPWRHWRKRKRREGISRSIRNKKKKRIFQHLLLRSSSSWFSHHPSLSLSISLTLQHSLTSTLFPSSHCYHHNPARDFPSLPLPKSPPDTKSNPWKLIKAQKKKKQHFNMNHGSRR